MKIRRIIASVLTFMMLFMNVPTNVFATTADNENTESEQIFTVTIPKQDEQYENRYILNVDKSDVKYGESCTLTFKRRENGIYFIIKVNDDVIDLYDDGAYTINNIHENIIITVEAFKDDTSPNVQITIGKNTWNYFTRKISYGEYFFNATQTAEIKATNEVSGIDKYYYAIDDSGIDIDRSLDTMSKIDKELNWEIGTFTPLSEHEIETSIPLSGHSHCAIYIKVVNKAGNRTYISTGGLTIDSKAPQIFDVESNQTYTKSQSFTVNDDNLATVKVDGKEVESINGSYTLVPKEGTYTIEATDKAGNKTTLDKITVNWEEVVKPTVKSKVYTGEKLIADIEENNLYKVVENKGGVDVGDYDVRLELNDPINYKWKDGNNIVKFSITQATPNLLTPTVKDLTYNGKEQELINAASTNVGTVEYSLDNKTWSTSIPKGKDAKQYTIYYKVEGNENYKGTDVQKVTNTIKSKVIGIDWKNISLTYNGNNQLPTATVNNLENGDECNITVIDANGDNHKNAGTYKAKATAVSNTNYQLPTNVTTQYIINPKVININWTNTSLTYNGNNQLPTVTADNLENGDECNITVVNVNGDNHKNVGTYKAEATAVSNTNYKLPNDRTTNYTIGRKQLSIKGLEAVNRKYNGKTEITLQGGELEGVIGTDKVSIDMPKIGTVENSRVGENKAVSYTKSTLSGDDKDNYELSWPSLTVTISKTDQSDTKITTTSNELDKEYDGYGPVDVESTSNNTMPPVVEYKIKDADDATYTKIKPKNAGEYTVRVTYPADENYTKSSVTKDFTIKKMEIIVSAINSSKTYGDKDNKLSYSLNRIAKDERLSGIVLTREKGENVGTYKITVSQQEGANPNYDITFKEGTFTITPLSIDKGTVILGKVLKYIGEKQTQEVEQVEVDGKVLNKEDYEVLNNQATAEGKHILTIKAKGDNCTGSFEYTYVILPKENIKIGTGTLDVKITGEIKVSKDDLIDILIENNQLSANELSEIAEGKEIEFILDVKDSTKTITKESKELIEANTKGYTIGKYLDITLYKTVNKTNEGIHELTKKLKVTISIPEELINKDSKVKREYAIVRNHNGKVEILEGSYDEKSHTYTFETDRFSDYAIIYKDTKEDSSDKKNNEVVDKDDKKEEVVNKDESTSSNQETVKPTVKKEIKTTVKTENKTETKKVKTGDNSNSIFYMGLIGVSLLGIYCFVMKKFIH